VLGTYPGFKCASAEYLRARTFGQGGEGCRPEAHSFESGTGFFRGIRAYAGGRSCETSVFSQGCGRGCVGGIAVGEGSRAPHLCRAWPTNGASCRVLGSRRRTAAPAALRGPSVAFGIDFGGLRASGSCWVGVRVGLLPCALRGAFRSWRQLRGLGARMPDRASRARDDHSSAVVARRFPVSRAVLGRCSTPRSGPPFIEAPTALRLLVSFVQAPAPAGQGTPPW